MIIVEGPDGAGKTTLISKLSNDLQLPVAPRVVSKETKALTNLRNWTDQNLAAGFKLTIFDRHRLISDPIYRFILNKPVDTGLYDPQWLALAHLKFQRIRPAIVYCLPPLEAVWANVKDDEDNVAVRDRIHAIYYDYVASMAQSMGNPRLRTFTYDYTRDQDGVEYDRILLSLTHVLNTEQAVRRARMLNDNW